MEFKECQDNDTKLITVGLSVLLGTVELIMLTIC